jgi:hypothetical protein
MHNRFLYIILFFIALSTSRAESVANSKNDMNKISVGIQIPSETSYVFFKSEKVSIKIVVDDFQKICGSQETILSLKVVDCSNGSEIFKREQKFLFKDGRFQAEFSLKPERFGCFYVTSVVTCGKESATGSYTFVVVPEPVVIAEGLMPFCGITGIPNGSPPKSQRIGGEYWYDCFNHWDMLEHDNVRGRYAIPDLAEFHDRGMKVKFTIGHLPGFMSLWAEDPADVADAKKKNIPRPTYGFLPSAKGMQGWREMIRQIVTKNKGKIDIFEIGAEDDLTFGNNPYYLQKNPAGAPMGQVIAGPDYDRYAEMLKAACEEIRKVDPSIKIGIVRPCGNDCRNYTFTTPAIKKCKGLFDLLPLDSYCALRYIGPEAQKSPLPEEFLPLYLTNALKTCRENGDGQKVYIAEFGYAMDIRVSPESSYAMDQAKRLARSYLVARMTPGVEAFFWFHPNGCLEATYYDYALWRNGMPMPSVAVYGAVSRIVENVLESKEIHFGDDVRAVVFRKKDRADAAIWFVNGAGKFSCDDISKTISVTDMMGNPISPKIEGKKSFFDVGEFPIYFSLDGANAFDTLVKTLSQGRMSCNPLKLALITPQGNQGTLAIKNQSENDIAAKISVIAGKYSMAKNLVIGKKAITSIGFPLDKMPLTVHVKIDCGKDYDKIVASYPVDLMPCNKIKSTVKIDGDISDWSGRPCIVMKDRSQIMPPDPWVEWKGPEHFSAKVYTGWDDKYFYLAAEVIDDVHFNNKPSYEIWAGDSIQFAFTPDIPGLDTPENIGYRKNDCELGLALTDKGPTAGKWAGEDDVWKNAEYTVKRDQASRKTFYEARIPLADLKIKSLPETVFGFGFVIFNDNTGAGANYYYQFCPGITGTKNSSLLKRFVLKD